MTILNPMRVNKTQTGFLVHKNQNHLPAKKLQKVVGYDADHSLINAGACLHPCHCKKGTGVNLHVGNKFKRYDMHQKQN